MKFSTISNIGRVRSQNQDFYGSVQVEDAKFFIVADGMGGYKGGEVASRLASGAFTDFIKKADRASFDTFLDLQEAAIKYANKMVYQASLEDSEYSDMGTTVVCVCLDYENKLYHVSHVGDSRAYVYKDKTLKQLTRDHSLVNDLLDSGSLTQLEAENFANKSTITRAVGIDNNLRIESRSFEMDTSEIILMVTDGLTNEVSNTEIETIVAQNDSVEDISKNLVELAIQKGGRDNITVTTIKI